MTVSSRFVAVGGLSGWVAGGRRGLVGLVALLLAVGLLVAPVGLSPADAQQDLPGDPSDEVDNPLDDGDDGGNGGGDDGPASLHRCHYRELPINGSADEVLLVDVSGNDRNDLIAVGTSGVWVWLAEAGAYFPYGDEPDHKYQRISDGNRVSAAVGDFDGDGRPDLAIAHMHGPPDHPDNKGSVEVWWNTGDPADPFTAPQRVHLFTNDTNGEPQGIAAADLTGDGHDDLAVPKANHHPDRYGDMPEIDGELVVLASAGTDRSFTLHDHLPLFYRGRHVAAADFTNNDHVDLAVATEAKGPGGGRGDNFVEVALNQGDGTFAHHSDIEKRHEPDIDYPYRASGGLPDDVVVADFPGAGDDELQAGQLDLVVGSGAGGATVMPGQADGSFGDAVIYGERRNNNGYGDAPGVGAADMTGDGKPDLLAYQSYFTGFVEEHVPSSVRLWSDIGDQSQSANRDADTCELTPRGDEWGAVGSLDTGDVTGNGEPDVAITELNEDENGDNYWHALVIHPEPVTVEGRVTEARSDTEQQTGQEPEGVAGAVVTATLVDPAEGWGHLAGWQKPMVTQEFEGEDGPTVTGETAEEDQAGWYRLEGLPPAGDYEVTVAHDDYETPEATRLEDVAPGAVERVDFALEPLLGVVEGGLAAAHSGEAITDRPVRVTVAHDEALAVGDDGEVATEGDPAGQVTSEEGAYRVSGLEPGDYRVAAEADGYETAAETFTIDDDGDDGGEVGVVGGEQGWADREVVDLVLEPEPGVIDGEVVDAQSGEPIGGAEVAATAGGGGARAGEADTGGEGAYEIAGVEPGDYRVTADADGYRRGVRSGVELGPAGVATVEFALQPRDDADDDDDDGGDGGGDGGSGDPAGESGGESGGEPAGEPGGEAGGEPGGEPAAESGGEAGGEPVGEPAGGPGAESAGEAGGEPAGEPVGEASGEPAGEAGGEPAGEAGGEPAGEPAGETSGEPVVESAADPVGQGAAEPAAASEAAGDSAVADPAADPAAADPAAVGVGGQSPPAGQAVADSAQPGAAPERVAQTRWPVETEPVPADPDPSGWLASATEAPGVAGGVWLAAVGLAGVAGWAGRRRGPAGAVRLAWAHEPVATIVSPAADEDTADVVELMCRGLR